MIINKVLLAAIFLSGMLVSAQAQQKFSKPNYKTIEKASKNRRSVLCNDSLMARYLKGDTTFSVREKEQLYYGFQFTDSYAPYVHSSFTDSLNKLFQKDRMEIGDYTQAVIFCDSVLRKDPFDIRILNVQANMYQKLALISRAERNIIKMNLIVDVILGSGNGLKANSAFYVINVSHEYAILSVLELEFDGAQSLIGQNDYLTVKPNDSKIEGIYFDISPSFNSMEKMFKD